MDSTVFLDISLKLKDLYEMTFQTGTDLKHSNEMINQVVKNFNDNGKVVTNKIEGGKFSLIKFKSYYALKRNLDNNILGWLLMSPRTKTILSKKYWELLENKSGTLYTKSYLPGVKDCLIYFILFSEDEE